MTAARPSEPKYLLLPATFPSASKANNWAFHVARTSQRRCRVRKIEGEWRVWATQPPKRGTT